MARSRASVLLDGRFRYVQVVGSEAMAIAAVRATQHGFAVVALRNSGRLGRFGAWAGVLACKNLVSRHFVNSSGLGILVALKGAAIAACRQIPLRRMCRSPTGRR